MADLTENCPPDPDRPPDGRGPWMLRISGMWGTGKHSRIWVQDADVLDLSVPPDDGDRELRGNEHLRQRQFVDNIVEDVQFDDESLPDIPFNDQVIRAPRSDDESWTVTDVE